MGAVGCCRCACNLVLAGHGYDFAGTSARLAFCRVGGVLRALTDVGAGLVPAAPDEAGFGEDVDVGPSAQWYLGGAGVYALFDHVTFVEPSSMGDCVARLAALAP